MGAHPLWFPSLHPLSAGPNTANKIRLFVKQLKMSTFPVKAFWPSFAYHICARSRSSADLECRYHPPLANHSSHAQIQKRPLQSVGIFESERSESVHESPLRLYSCCRRCCGGGDNCGAGCLCCCCRSCCCCCSVGCQYCEDGCCRGGVREACRCGGGGLRRDRGARGGCGASDGFGECTLPFAEGSLYVSDR